MASLIPGNLHTTAMAILPHDEVDEALKLALSLDIPFWPLDHFLAQIDQPRGIHLCGNPDWEFLLKRDLDILSMDIYTNAEIFRCYGPDIRRFMERGAVLSWGIVPTGFEAFDRESQDHLISSLEDIWGTLYQAGIDQEQLLAQSLLGPATCCLINPDREKTVAKAYAWVQELSSRLREKYSLK
ncbi:MAG: hypothetical protein JRI50_04440 [Deltaproteobacteria bacterium]|nr:hypothetical protein [Deltaproteobacteria bacterium]MBW1986469.1 hypothetical protein [Deltaproteobacteria bacterium]